MGNIQGKGLYLSAFLPAAIPFFFVGGNRAFLPRAIFLSIFWILLCSLALLGLELKKSLRKTLYSYKNIMLIGGLLFLSTMTVALAVARLEDFWSGDLSARHIYESIVAFPRQFSYYAVFILTAICVLVGISNLELIRREGFRLHNALSVLVGVLYIGGTIVIYILSDFLERMVAEKTAWMVWLNTTFPLFCLLMLCYFECVLAGTAVMGYKAARQVPSYDKDYIIILGCSIDKRGGLLPLLKGRVNRAIRYAWEQEIATGKPVKYIPSGGKGSNEVISEGSAMELYLLAHGAENDEVFPEKQSRNTYENMLFSKKIIEEQNPNAKVAFATTNYHMLRSGILAQQVGMDAEGIAGDTKWYFWPNGFIREFFALLVMQLRVHVTVGVLMALLSMAVGFIAAFGLF